MNIKNELKKWASHVFNDEEFKDKPLMLQSPLTVFEDETEEKEHYIDTMIIGLNPADGSAAKTAEELLAGNPAWKSRFDNEILIEGQLVSKHWWKFFGEAHYFVTQDYECHPMGFDNDKKTVWTNLTPVIGPRVNSAIERMIKRGVSYTVELINILKPKRIILLSCKAFDYFENYKDKGFIVTRHTVAKSKMTDKRIEIGCINNIPTIQVAHPSSNWGFPKLFIPTAIAMHKRYIQSNKLPINLMRRELNQWFSQIDVE